MPPLLTLFTVLTLPVIAGETPLTTGELRGTYAVGGIALLRATPVPSAQLVTKGYDIQIHDQCAEGEVTCEQVGYLGVSRPTGQSIRLTGTTRHAPCTDGVTPSRFLGYEFRNGNVTYFVSADGELVVTDTAGRLLVQERGQWTQ
jgi:hypothetical protein